MTMYRNIGGTWRSGTLWRNIGGTWRQGILWRNISGTWKAVSGAMLTTGTFFSAGTYSGYAIGSFGSLSPDTAWPFGTSLIGELYHFTGTGKVRLSVAGAHPNSGWTTLHVDGTTFNRASATYAGGGPTSWEWTASNPFGIGGATRTITFT